MARPLMPSPLDCVGPRPFAFYPPIENIHPNEWRLGAGSWSEIEAVNSRTGHSIWIPRQHIGAVCEDDGHGFIVGLTQKLAYRAGEIAPRVKRVIEMPPATGVPQRLRFPEPERFPGPAAVVAIRLDNRNNPRRSKALAAFGIGAVLLSLLGALVSSLASQPLQPALYPENIACPAPLPNR